MSLLLVVMVLCSLAAIALGVAGRRRARSAALAAEVVMVLAMLDLHLPAAGFLAPPLWAAALAGCALVPAVVDRGRRHAAPAPAGDRLHAVGMLLGAGLVLLAGTSAAASADAGPHQHAVHQHAAHQHVAQQHVAQQSDSLGGLPLVPLALLGVAGYGVLVLVQARRRHGAAGSTGAIASLGALVAMGWMVAVG